MDAAHSVAMPLCLAGCSQPMALKLGMHWALLMPCDMAKAQSLTPSLGPTSDRQRYTWLRCVWALRGYFPYHNPTATPLPPRLILDCDPRLILDTLDAASTADTMG